MVDERRRRRWTDRRTQKHGYTDVSDELTTDFIYTVWLFHGTGVAIICKILFSTYFCDV